MREDPGNAAEALPAVISHYHSIWGARGIASPAPDVLLAVKEVAERGDAQPETLANTWLAILHALRAHTSAGGDGCSSPILRAAGPAIRELYLPPRLTATRMLGSLAAAQDDRLAGLSEQRLRRSFDTPRRHP